MHKSYYVDNMQNRIKELYKQGFSQEEIAKLVGLNQSTVSRVLNLKKIKKTKKNNTLEAYRRILDHFNEIEKELAETGDFFSDQELESLSRFKSSFILGISNIIRETKGWN
jgi:predicted transcriptional regulator